MSEQKEDIRVLSRMGAPHTDPTGVRAGRGSDSYCKLHLQSKYLQDGRRL
jgi:hypothetical protein